MQRRMIIAFLTLGTLVGYGSGLAHFARAHHAHCAQHVESQ
jgi:hypothetical protein